MEADCACEMLAVEPVGLPPAGLAEGLRGIGRLTARADARRAAWIAEAERTDAARKQGYRTTTEWLAAISGEPVPVVRSQVAVAEALEQMPETKRAFTAGEVSESRVKMLAQAQALAPDQFAQDEGQLVTAVADASAQQVPRVLATWKHEADPKAAETEVERLHRMRALHVSKHWTGMVHLSGDLDPERGLTVLAALRALSEPAALDPADTRTPAQCRADALVEICRRYLQGDGDGSRRRPQVLVTIPWDTLHTGKGVVDTEAGPLS
ncbi:MAG: 13E12 repeat family protein, partial [Acidimicrobiia bacterium]|nr:13E12 repeat family protein [Acidimicrobiia bacterium]